jgi:asparagine synthase (glutamine-hydrolysing)
MCGISGFLSDHPERDIPVVERQIALLEHRGPDAYGWWTGSGCVLAQNRLSIIDVEGGDPPITNEDGSVGVVLNGEIYNFPALQDELRAGGHRLGTRCDTEVIAHLAETLDPVALAQRLDGMFAFAVWRERDRRLVLGRDRLGKKPLYYFHRGDTFVFGSELKAVLAHPDVPRELDADAIGPYLSFGYVPSPRTIYAGVRSVPPGCVLTLEPGGEPRIERYWRTPRRTTAARDLSYDEAVTETRDRLRHAVSKRLISDVPLGAFLSGGIDSSAVVAMMAEVSDRPVETFTIGFDDTEGFDERPYASTVAQAFRTNHHEFVVHPDAIDLVERLVWFHDQPFGDSSAIPTFLLSEMTSNHVTVALAGDGGDELFAGYERFIGGVAAQSYERLPRIARRAVEGALAVGPAQRVAIVPKLQRFAARAGAGMPTAFRQWISYVPDEDTRALTGHANGWGVADYEAAWDRTAGAATLDRLLALNLETYLLDDLLVKVDRMSMAHGLEVRSPFLDYEFVEFAASLRPSFKARGLTLKRVLKDAIRPIVPAEILSRGKRGFGVPLDRWFRSDLRAYAEGMLLGDGARVRHHLDEGALRRIVAEHMSGARNNGHTLWTLLTLEVFLRREGW